ARLVPGACRTARVRTRDVRPMVVVPGAVHAGPDEGAAARGHAGAALALSRDGAARRRATGCSRRHARADGTGGRRDGLGLLRRRLLRRGLFDRLLRLLAILLLGRGGQHLELARAVAVHGDALAAGGERQRVSVVDVADAGVVGQVDGLRDRVRDLLAAIEGALHDTLHLDVVGRRDVVRAAQHVAHGGGHEVEALHRAVVRLHFADHLVPVPGTVLVVVGVRVVLVQQLLEERVDESVVLGADLAVHER